MSGSQYELPLALPQQPDEQPKSPKKPSVGRSLKHDVSTWTVTDDWPDIVPITEAEIEVFERWFGDFFDEIFGPEDPTDTSKP